MVSETQNIPSVSIEREMKTAYLDYAMSVIVSRALPDCRDGLKPVHRRILFAMKELGIHNNKPYKKSARIVGEVIGKFHPHGDSPIYQALVRMAQEFSLRELLVEGQGNFGSIDGDAPAAMRYTEARLSKISSLILQDIDQNTVDFQDNYDGSEREPKVMPSRFPNLLINGASGIAVGMATNIPTHNLSEVIDGCIAHVNNPEITIEELTNIIPAPDFPTGGMIVGGIAARKALMTGRGSIIMRGRVDIEQIGGKHAIIITEVPYQVNKAELVKKIEFLSKEKTVEGISEIRDESNKLGIRVVIELRRDAIPDLVINQLYKHSNLQTSFGVNMLALNKGRPMLMNIKDVISSFIEFRIEVVTRRTIFELNKARKRAHNLIGLSIAVSNIDEVIALIKAAPNPQEAKKSLMAKSWRAESVAPLLKLVDDYRNELTDGKCKFTNEQADAILEMKLSRLTGLEKGKIEAELERLAKDIAEYLDILGSPARINEIIIEELEEVKQSYGNPRKTEIISSDHDVNDEDLIQREEVVVTYTMGGFIKRVPLATYRAQRRGGKGRSGMSTYDDDSTTDILAVGTHAPLLFFSSKGQVYRMKVYRIPEGSPQSKGRALVNMLPLTQDERITNIMPLPEDQTTWEQYSIIFATKKGNIRRNDLSAFENIQSNGKIAIRLDEDDALIGVKIAQADEHVMLCTKDGKALRFPLDKLRVFKSRNSDGVRGIKLANEKDEVVSMTILNEGNVGQEVRNEFLNAPVGTRLEYAKDKNVEKLIQNSGLNEEIINHEQLIEMADKEQFILTVTENGYGKRTSSYEYRTTGRGGQGILNIDTGERNGSVIASMPVESGDQVMLLTSSGQLIRTDINDIRITGRNAKGVRIMNLDKQKIISVTRIAGESMEEDNDTMENDGSEEPVTIN